MNEIFQQLKERLKGDHVIWLIFFTLIGISTVEIFSASSRLAFITRDYVQPLIKHICTLGAGVLIAYFFSRFPLNVFMKKFVVLGILALSVFALVCAVFFGTAREGASRSIFGIQPIEFIKVSVVLLLALMLSSKRMAKEPDKVLRDILLYLSLPLLLVMMQNMSSMILITVVFFCMIYVGQIRFVRIAQMLGVLAVAGAAAFFVGTHFTSEQLGPFGRLPTQARRVQSMIDKTGGDDEAKFVLNDDNRQINNSLIAIANGRIYPRMPGCSVQRDYLSEAYSDFVFAIIVEELGTFGGIFIILLYIALLFRVGLLVRRCDRTYPALLMIGMMTLVVAQALIHIEVTCDIGPVTGQPLPLISKGGSSILVSGFAFGMILNASQQITKKQKSSENKEKKSENNDKNNETEPEILD